MGVKAGVTERTPENGTKRVVTSPSLAFQEDDEEAALLTAIGYCLLDRAAIVVRRVVPRRVSRLVLRLQALRVAFRS